MNLHTNQFVHLLPVVLHSCLVNKMKDSSPAESVITFCVNPGAGPVHTRFPSKRAGLESSLQRLSSLISLLEPWNSMSLLKVAPATAQSHVTLQLPPNPLQSKQKSQGKNAWHKPSKGQSHWLPVGKSWQTLLLAERWSTH